MENSDADGEGLQLRELRVEVNGVETVLACSDAQGRGLVLGSLCVRGGRNGLESEECPEVVDDIVILLSCQFFFKKSLRQESNSQLVFKKKEK